MTTKGYYFITKNYYFDTVSILVSAKQACYHYSDEKNTNKFTYKTSKKLIYSHFYFYCSCSNIIMAIETEMFRLLFYAMKGGELDGVIYEREGTAGYVRE